MNDSEAPRRLKALEFFCGIGGFHFALKDVSDSIDVIGAFDINTTTNRIYAFNFPDTKLYQKNIQALTTKFVDKQMADIWTLSSPCQPFVKKGLQLDLKDARCDALKQICDRIREVQHPPRFIMVENVVGFEDSAAEEMFLGALDYRGYEHEAHLLSPVECGIPNSRPRYYILAKLNSDDAIFGASSIKTQENEAHVNQVKEYLSFEAEEDPDLFLPLETILKHRDIIDLVEPKAVRTACFTKAYGHYVKGTGSLLVSRVPCSHEDKNFTKADFLGIMSSGQDEVIASLRIRYLSVEEVSRLMGFRNRLRQPPEITRSQMYRGLGNSVSVFVVALLLKRLLCEAW